MRKGIRVVLATTAISMLGALPAFAAGDEIASIPESYDLSKVEADGTQNADGVDQFGPVYSMDNPFYGLNTSDGVTISMEISDVGYVNNFATIFGFRDAAERQRMFMLLDGFFGVNLGGDQVFDANHADEYLPYKSFMKDNGDGELRICIEKDAFQVYYGGVLQYDQSMIKEAGLDGWKTLDDEGNYNFTDLLDWLGGKASTFELGTGSFWRAVDFDEANCSVRNVRFYLGEVPPEGVELHTTAGSTTSDTQVAEDADSSDSSVEKDTVAETAKSGADTEAKKSENTANIIVIIIALIVVIAAVVIVLFVVNSNKSKVRSIDD